MIVDKLILTSIVIFVPSLLISILWETDIPEKYVKLIQDVGLVIPMLVAGIGLMVKIWI